MKNVIAGIDAAAGRLGTDNDLLALRAIMTTDTRRSRPSCRRASAARR